MTLTDIILTLSCCLLIILFLLHLLQALQKKNNKDKIQEEAHQLDNLIRQEFIRNRQEMQVNDRASREELAQTINRFSIQLSQSLQDLAIQQQAQMSTLSSVLQQLSKNNEEKMGNLQEQLSKNALFIKDALQQQSNENRRILQENMKVFQEQQRHLFNDLFTRQEALKQATENKLEEIRNTVDEKLQTTLEKRFNESFSLISNRLETVHQGLGEMQRLATNVGDLKKVMSNVKSRGVLGEYQLAGLLEDLLTAEQYGKNVQTKNNSGAFVEFAVKLPGSNDDRPLWLPIDAKFPKEDFELLQEAYEEGHPLQIDYHRKNFKNAIIKNAKEIREKYIDPPSTTEYGILFLPFESLYAEVLRIPGLFEQLQKEYKITITGPTTLSALLNSLQIGFRTLAIERRSSEVWDLLSIIRTEFERFGFLLERTRKKLQEASNTIEQAGVRSRAIERQLRQTSSLSNNQLMPLEDEKEDSV